jgi:hypothetical protein
VIALAWRLLAGCAVPMMLPGHDPAAILAAPLAPEPGTGGPSFERRRIELVFDGDATVAPTGALLDDLHRSVTPTQQTYLLPQPGLALFESLAAVLAERGADVSRRYGGADGDGTVVGVSIAHLELHRWRTRDGDFQLVRAEVSWRFPTDGGGTIVRDTVLTRVPISRDPLLAAAGQLATALHGRMP